MTRRGLASFTLILVLGLVSVARLPTVTSVAGFAQSKNNNDGIHMLSQGELPPGIQQPMRQAQEYRRLAPEELRQLLAAREAVWRAYFSDDRAQLEKYLPEELITIGPGIADWGNRAGVMSGASRFVQTGGKLSSIEFPRTEIQAFGNVIIVYSEYRLGMLIQGKKITQAGVATEIFVKRDGTYVNTGWHLNVGQ